MTGQNGCDGHISGIPHNSVLFLSGNKHVATRQRT